MNLDEGIGAGVEDEGVGISSPDAIRFKGQGNGESLGRYPDGDFMPDNWEMEHFGSLDQVNPDWDNDGQSNFEEYIADSNPTNPASFFAVEDMTAPTLIWTAKPGRTYSVDWTDDLQQPFTRIASGITDGSYTDNSHSNSRFNYYRIRVELSP